MARGPYLRPDYGRDRQALRHDLIRRAFTVRFRGTVFALTPNAAKTKWAETVLHSFCALLRNDGWNAPAPA